MALDDYLKLPDDGCRIIGDKQLAKVVDDHFVHANWSISRGHGLGKLLAGIDVTDDSLLKTRVHLSRKIQKF